MTNESHLSPTPLSPTNPGGGLTRIDLYADATASAPVRTQTFAHDHNGNLTQVSDSAIQANALYTLAYDELNRVSQALIHYIPGGDRQLDYRYDAFGNREGFSVVEGGTTINHHYRVDALNRMQAVSLANNRYALHYDLANQLVGIDYPNGVQAEYVYENTGVVKTIAVKNAQGNPLRTVDYSYDAVLNVDTLTDDQGLYDFDYDGLNRLTLAEYPENSGLPDKEEFNYDQVGNREQPSNPTAWEYDDNNRLTQGPLYRYEYDDDGSMTRRTRLDGNNANSFAATFSYDLVNRLVKVSTENMMADYVYDPGGRRIKKQTNGETIWFLWDGDQLVAEYNAMGELTRRYDYVPGSYSPWQVSDGEGIYVVHTDHLDTPKMLTDSNGMVVWRGRSRAFGETVVEDDPDGDGERIEVNFRFPGQYFDKETGLHYNYYRDYDPSLGRYVQSDPIGLDGGLNTYAYVSGNPLINTDPLGLFQVPPPRPATSTTTLLPYLPAGLQPCLVCSTRDLYPPLGSNDNVIPFPGPDRKKEKERSDNTCPGPDEDGEDPCEEWLDDLLQMSLAVRLGLVQVDDLEKQALNNSIRKFKRSCPHLAGEIGFL